MQDIQVDAEPLQRNLTRSTKTQVPLISRHIGGFVYIHVLLDGSILPRLIAGTLHLTQLQYLCFHAS